MLLAKSLMSPPLRKSYQVFRSPLQLLGDNVRWMHSASHEDLRVCFVHTPMASVDVPGRAEFWTNFDRRYYAVHPGLKPVDSSIWELPHWMTWLGGVLKAENFRNISALSLYTAVNVSSGINREFIHKELQQNPADVYLFSPMTPNLHFAYEIAAMIKSQYPNSKTIFGGVIATPLHVKVATHTSVDYVVRDRGETALPILLKAIAEERDITTSNLSNITTKKENGIWSSSKLYPYVSPEDIPFPLYDLFPSEVGDSLRYIRQNYALGCPFACSFCTIQTIGRKPGYFPIPRVLSEIAAYRSQYGKHHNIYFGDETFTLDPKRTLEICGALQQQADITYDIQTRLTSLNNRQVLGALRDSGCKWVEVGIESLVQKSMFVHKQSTNLSKIRDMLKRLRDHDLPVCSFIINGLPEQSLDEMHRSTDQVCELLQENLLHASYFFGLVPYPGSEMYSSPEKFGMRLLHHDYSLYNEDLPPVYETPHATSEQIYEVFLEGVKKIGKAMNSKPYLGKELPPEVESKLGKSLTHV